LRLPTESVSSICKVMPGPWIARGTAKRIKLAPGYARLHNFCSARYPVAASICKLMAIALKA
jgi:hypothetical protein